MKKQAIDQWLKFFTIAAFFMLFLLIIVCINGCSGGGTATPETKYIVYESPEAHVTVTISYETEEQRCSIMSRYGRHVSVFKNSVENTWDVNDCAENDCFENCVRYIQKE